VSGIVEFTPEVSSWAYRCVWGCYQIDFEGEQAALDGLLNHDCVRTS
jgi:hypothetical protein